MLAALANAKIAKISTTHGKSRYNVARRLRLKRRAGRHQEDLCAIRIISNRTGNNTKLADW